MSRSFNFFWLAVGIAGITVMFVTNQFAWLTLALFSVTVVGSVIGIFVEDITESLSDNGLVVLFVAMVSILAGLFTAVLLTDLVDDHVKIMAVMWVAGVLSYYYIQSLKEKNDRIRVQQ